MLHVLKITVICSLFLNGCLGQDKSKSNKIYQKLDSLGRVVEEWGYEEEYDGNFRTFLSYNKNGNLIREVFCSLEPDNKECKVTDTLGCIETLYEYKGDRLYLEKKYRLELDDSGKIISRLFYVFNHFKNIEDITSPTKDQ